MSFAQIDMGLFGIWIPPNLMVNRQFHLLLSDTPVYQVGFVPHNLYSHSISLYPHVYYRWFVHLIYIPRYFTWAVFKNPTRVDGYRGTLWSISIHDGNPHQPVEYLNDRGFKKHCPTAGWVCKLVDTVTWNIRIWDHLRITDVPMLYSLVAKRGNWTSPI